MKSALLGTIAMLAGAGTSMATHAQYVSMTNCTTQNCLAMESIAGSKAGTHSAHMTPWQAKDSQRWGIFDGTISRVLPTTDRIIKNKATGLCLTLPKVSAPKSELYKYPLEQQPCDYVADPAQLAAYQVLIPWMVPLLYKQWNEPARWTPHGLPGGTVFVNAVGGLCLHAWSGVTPRVFTCSEAQWKGTVPDSKLFQWQWQFR
jgi:hypothetical protein